MVRQQIIIIPVYKPTVQLIDLIAELKKCDFMNIVIVNDGSGEEYTEIFEKVRGLGCELVNHRKNYGKGQALKTGIRNARNIFGLDYGFITVDADGQHLVADVVKVAKAMSENPDSLIMGTRDFNVKNIPKKSYFGNKITSFVFNLNTGVSCKDTQTGLRGIPKLLVDLALNTEGKRYEYEFNFLSAAVETTDIVSLSINTVYFNSNESSHFRPVKDSLLVYGKPIKFLVSSILSAVFDLGVFYVFSLIFQFSLVGNIVLSTVIARLLSGVLNFTLNKKFVFMSSKKTKTEIIKYALLFFLVMGLSALGTSGLTMALESSVIAKIIVDAILFIFSYYMQKNWVFTKKFTLKKASKVWKYLATMFFVFYVGFTLINRFIIPQNVIAMYKEEYTQELNNTVQIQPEITDNSYKSESIQVTISTIRDYDTDIYIAEVIIGESQHLRAGLAENSFGNNLKDTTSEIAKENYAILAINGDYYGFRDDGYVMRNGYMYREQAADGENEDLVIYEDGSMEVIDESQISAQELQEQGAVQIYSFGPGLISDGEITVDENSQVDREKTNNPRTAIGMIAPNHYIFMVADGRSNISTGLSLEEMAIVLKSYNCEVAYNLDGGGSSTMVFMGEVINNPTSNGKEFKERSVSDIVYIGE